MLRVNYLESLMNTYEMLKDLDGQEVCLNEIKTLKKDFKKSRKATTSTIETLRRLGVLLKTDREEDVIITLKEPTIVKEIVVNGQKISKRLNEYDIKDLKNLGLKVKVTEKETCELQVKKCYYKVCLGHLTTKINYIRKTNKQAIDRKIKQLKKELKFCEKLLTI